MEEIEAEDGAVNAVYLGPSPATRLLYPNPVCLLGVKSSSGATNLMTIRLSVSCGLLCILFMLVVFI